MYRPSDKAARLLICLFHFLDQETKNKMMAYVCGNILDGALRRMIKEKLLPDWFCEEFQHYDPLYGKLDGLRYAIIYAIRSRLMELISSAGTSRYGFPMSEEECAERLAELNIAIEDTRRWAQTLQQYLSGKE